MSQSKKAMSMLTNSVVLLAITVVFTLVVIVIMSAGIGNLSDKAIQILVNN